MSMTRERLFELHQELVTEAFQILKQKNADYSKDLPLGNFYLSEALQVCTAENGIINRIGDKLSRLVSITAKGNQVKNEAVRDTVIDVINYIVLFYGVHLEKEAGKLGAEK